MGAEMSGDAGAPGSSRHDLNPARHTPSAGLRRRAAAPSGRAGGATSSDDAAEESGDEQPPDTPRIPRGGTSGGDTTGKAPQNGPAARDNASAGRATESQLPRRSLRRRVLRALGIATALLVLASAGAAYLGYRKLNSNIRTDDSTAQMLDHYASQRPEPVISSSATNILLIGSDDRSGANSRYGGDGGSQRSDTTILLHLSADRQHATAISIPRDLMAELPACERPDGSETRPQFAQFNWAFEFGGAACTIRTVENMTGIRIDHHLIVDFTGFKNLVNAVGGVEVCLPEPVHDQDAKLDLPAGRQTVTGENALAYVRARHSFGDGSDTQRIGRQQQFLGSLAKKMKSSGVLLNPVKLYPMLDAATSSLTADSGLNSLSELYGLVRGLQKTPTDNVAFVTAPREPYSADPNRDQLVQPQADALFRALREDHPVNVTDATGEGSVQAKGLTGTGHRERASTLRGTSMERDAQESTPSPEISPSPSVGEPSFTGITADHDICGTS